MGRVQVRRPWRISLAITVLALALPVTGLLGELPFASASRELIPNLRALPASELRLETTSDGTILLRFSATSWNAGEGPLELVAGEVDRGNGKQRVYQRIHSDDGSHRDVLAGSFEWHEAHDHFHFDDYALYTLQPASAPGASERIGSKTTFCVMDTDRVNHRLPGAPKRPVYSTCGRDIQGMSVGWGDTYRYYLAGQEIDVTGLPAGEYNLTVIIDPKDRLIELDDSDNSATVRIALDPEAGTVSVVGDDGGSSGGPGNGRGGPPNR
jgi:hypothetical protein